MKELQWKKREISDFSEGKTYSFDSCPCSKFGKDKFLALFDEKSMCDGQFVVLFVVIFSDQLLIKEERKTLKLSKQACDIPHCHYVCLT